MRSCGRTTAGCYRALGHQVTPVASRLSMQGLQGVRAGARSGTRTASAASTTHRYATNFNARCRSAYAEIAVLKARPRACFSACSDLLVTRAAHCCSGPGRWSGGTCANCSPGQQRRMSRLTEVDADVVADLLRPLLQCCCRRPQATLLYNRCPSSCRRAVATG